MNSKLSVLLAAGCASLVFAADQPRREPTELEKLKAKVELLEGRVNQLEARLLDLSQTRRTLFEAPQALPQGYESEPPNVGQLEINGLKIYKVPLAVQNR